MRVRRSGLLAAVVAALVALVTASASGSGARAAGSSGFGSPHVLLRGVRGYTVAEATGGTVWVAVGPPSGETVLHELDAVTGAAGPQRSLGRVKVGDLLYALGWLWVTTAPWNGHGGGLLWRLDPKTLAVLSQTRVGTGFVPPSIASAGASIWAGVGRYLYRVAAIGGTVTARVQVPGAGQIQVATGAGGRNLLVSEGNGGRPAHIQRRDGVTGKLLATSARFLGVSEPMLGGTFGDRLWFSEATGTAGYFGQLNAHTLKPSAGVLRRARTEMPSNAIRAQAIDGILWVSDPGAGVGAALNYCGNPRNGRPRLALPRAVRRGGFMTADAHRIYFLSAYGGTLMSATIPAGCR